jgi:hypothetical protein
LVFDIEEHTALCKLIGVMLILVKIKFCCLQTMFTPSICESMTITPKKQAKIVALNENTSMAVRHSVSVVGM